MRYRKRIFCNVTFCFHKITWIVSISHDEKFCLEGATARRTLYDVKSRTFFSWPTKSTPVKYNQNKILFYLSHRSKFVVRHVICDVGQLKLCAMLTHFELFICEPELRERPSNNSCILAFLNSLDLLMYRYIFVFKKLQTRCPKRMSLAKL